MKILHYPKDCGIIFNLNHQNDGSTDTVRKIIQSVRNDGDIALKSYCRKFEYHESLIAKDLEIEEGYMRVANKQPDLVDALKTARDRISEFHLSTLPSDINVKTDNGAIQLGYKWTKIDRVGVYIPGGLASYPSSVLMNVIPAQVAGVEKVYCTTPAKNGVIPDNILCALYLCGIQECYKIGGAAAIAAFTFGTDTVCKVDKIIGPGNGFVAEAKRQVFGFVGIDSIAGPSDVCVICDADQDPNIIALDLLAQAEHGDDSRAILITNNEQYATSIIDICTKMINISQRKDILEKSFFGNSFAIIVNDLYTESADVANVIAPEHLEIFCRDAEGILNKIKHAGAVFIGHLSCEAMGDYILGPSHTLPTNGTARFSSGLSVYDFIKKVSVIRVMDAVPNLVKKATVIANSEGLEMHANSLSIRLSS